MMILVWNGYKGEVLVFKASEEMARGLAATYLEDGSDVIYFFVTTEGVFEKEWDFNQVGYIGLDGVERTTYHVDIGPEHKAVFIETEEKS